eukprot:IDg8089t1
MQFATLRGFAWDKDDFRRALTQIDVDGRQGFRTKAGPHLK